MAMLIYLSFASIVLLPSIVAPVEFCHSDQVCLINEPPTEEYPFGSSLIFKVSINPERSIKVSQPILIVQENETISVTMDEPPGAIISFDVITAGRFSNMEICWPNGERV
ncbi:MAG: hypothetical protein PHR47_02405 [Candidatus Pacebacteria bacterium]|nr:hypothetical protein [Candidatus Paceibacterota bacterium]